MKIPIRNLYYLLCYAWDALEEREVVDVGEITSPDTRDLMAHVLASGVRHALRRGLDRGYVETREESSYLRGRIDFQRTTQAVLERKHQAAVIYEELSPDTDTNRILKASMRLMRSIDGLDPKLRDGLISLERSMWQVSDVRLSPSAFRRVRIHRNNRQYLFLLDVCEMIYDYVLPDQQGAGSKFRDFVQDDQRMRALFQKFVTNFYRHEQRRFTVEVESLRWADTKPLDTGGVSLPIMRTDLVLTNATEKIVIDTKFTPDPIHSYFGSQTLNSEHVYQIFAYMRNIAVADPKMNVSGILLYPGAGLSPGHRSMVQGMLFRAASLDLTKEWPDIRQDLLCLVEAQ